MHVRTEASPHSRWFSLPLGAISVTDGLWRAKQETNRKVSLRHGYRQLERAGNFNNLRLAAEEGEGDYRSPVFMDSDIYKWLEAAALDLATVRDPEVEQMVEAATELIVAAQAEDGYLDSYFQVVGPEARWSDLDHGHELYCAGHFFEAAIAMKRATGDGRLLAVAQRLADYIDSVFGPGKRDGTPGHPEIELALVELYRETGERRYLDLAQYFVDQRGSGRMRGYRHYGAEYHQDHVPVRDAGAVVGHAVRQLYLTAGVTDLYLETGEDALHEAMQRLWHDMTAHKMHITAGLGARFTGESFGDPYELPADRCYCETCAAIANIMWNWRLLLATGEGRYADLLERSLYNGFLSGVSQDGARYFYVNPLQSRGGVERPEWYGCACCPPNVMRTIALVGHYAATVGDGGVQLHQYMASTVDTRSVDGPGAVLSVRTDYPWGGEVAIEVVETGGEPWPLSLRVPQWSPTPVVKVNGVEVTDAVAEDGYLTVRGAWQSGDVVSLSLGLEPRLTAPNPRVDAIRGSVCVERGPLVYAVESIDQQDGVDLLDVSVGLDVRMASTWEGDLLGGVVAVDIPAEVTSQGDWEGNLYLPPEARTGVSGETVLRAVPYYAWANRGAGTMRVWLPSRQK